jgi:ABC-type dipeptide/oligopeptide/nickel transport system permease component
MRFIKFLGRRVFYLSFQLVGVVTIAFFLIRIIPGNPAYALAGIGARKETVAEIERRLGLDKPLPVQYVYFWRDLSHGYLGESIITAQPVTQDLKQRIPATLELTLTSIIICVVVGTPLGLFVALRKGGVVEKIVFAYGMLTGGIPDFWLGLIFAFVFFFMLRWAPAPMGRLGVLANPPNTITGFYLVDSALQGNWEALGLAAAHLALPVLTLVVVYMGNIVKMARSSMEEVAGSEFMEYARACGLPRWTMIRYQLRNALAPVVTVVAFTNGFLLGGTVLVEKVFSWGGVGEYAIQSITNADYWPLQGFVLAAAGFMAINYLVLDILYAMIDPRVTTM